MPLDEVGGGRRQRGAASWLRSYLLVGMAICCICTTLVVWNCSCSVESSQREHNLPIRETATPMATRVEKPRTFLLIAVLSSPGDSAIRAVIRDSWMRLSSSKARGTVIVRFPLGTNSLSVVEKERLTEEQAAHGDLALLPLLVEHYSNLTRKTLATMQWAHQHYDFDFLLKVDSDSFVRLGALLKSLRDVAHPRLYWGFLDGRAKPIRKGKWKESDWILCDRYLPYQLGGGYVLAYDLVAFLAQNARLLKLYKNEDVAVGTWLAGLDVKYVHDPRFDTEFRSRGCSNEYLITHKKTPAEMLALYASLVGTQKLCEQEFRSRASYMYDWSVPPSQCCARSNSSKIP